MTQLEIAEFFIFIISGKYYIIVKRIEESKDHIIIGFSKSKIYDGRIRYDRKREYFTAISIPKDCDEFDCKRLFQFLYGLID